MNPSAAPHPRDTAEPRSRFTTEDTETATDLGVPTHDPCSPPSSVPFASFVSNPCGVLCDPVSSAFSAARSGCGYLRTPVTR